MSTTGSARRWLQFGLRGLFVGVTLLAMFLAWLGYNLNWIHERRNAPVFYSTSEVALRTPSGPKLMTMTCQSPWPLQWLGEPGFPTISLASSLPENEVERIRRLFPEAEIVPLPPESEQEIAEVMSSHPEEVLAAKHEIREEMKAAQREWAKWEAENRR